MKYLALLSFILIGHICIGQNNHYLMLGANYPMNASEPNIARGFGVEFGYQYSKILNNYFSINSGIRFDIYEKFEEKMIGLDIIMPIKIGYSINKTIISGGFSLNAAQFISVGKYMGQDPEIAPVYRSPYFDMNTTRTFGIGLNVTIDYYLSKQNKLYIDFVRIKLKDIYLADTKYHYGIVTIGWKHKLNH